MARSINPENYEKVPGDKKGRYQLKTNHSHTISNRKYREAQTGKTLEQQRDIHYQSLSAHEVNKRSNKRTAYTQHLDEFVTAYNQRQTPENRITKTQARQMGLFQKEHQFRVRQEKVEPIVRAELKPRTITSEEPAVQGRYPMRSPIEEYQRVLEWYAEHKDMSALKASGDPKFINAFNEHFKQLNSDTPDVRPGGAWAKALVDLGMRQPEDWWDVGETNTHR